VAATDIFLPINKLGQGGFGEVYKVLLLHKAITVAIYLQVEIE